MVLKTVDRAAVTCWSPASYSEPLLALGTVAGALDASFSSKTELEIFSLNLSGTGKEMKKLGGIASNARFNRIAWGSGVIACGKENGEMDLWDASKVSTKQDEKAALNLRTKNHSGPVRGLDFNSIDTHLLASGSTDGELGQPYAPGAKSQRLEDVTCLAWNKQVPHILSSGSSNGYTVVWDLRNRRELISIPYPGGRKPVTCIAWNPDNPTQMVTCNDDDSNPVILMWDLRNASAAEKGIMCMDWCPKDSGLLISGGKDNRTIVWDTATGQPIGDLAHSANWTFDTKWCPRNPDLCVIASFDGQVSLHSIQTSSDHPDDDAFSPTAINDQPQLDPNDPFAQIGVQHHVQKKLSQPVFSLPHPPKWLRRPVGAVWGFGGSLVTFNSAKPSLVSVKKVPVCDEISFRADQLDFILRENNFETSAQYCDYMAHSEFVRTDDERDFWKFLKGVFAPAARDDMADFLGYDPSFTSDARLSKLLKKLDIAPLVVLDESSEEQPILEAPDVKYVSIEPFALYSTKATEECEIDTLITKSVIVGNFERAVSLCLAANRVSDALVLAMNGSPELLEKAQKEFFKRNSGTKSYVRILQAVVDGDLTDIISNAKLDGKQGWRDIIALICTYAKQSDFSAFFSILGKRLTDPAFTGLKDANEKDHAAALCFIGAGELEKVVEIWCHPSKEKATPDDIITQSLAERLSIFRQAIQFQDPDLELERFSEEPSSLKELYNVYVRFAWLSTAQGKLDVAWRFLEQVPLNFVPDLDVDIVILRDRVYSSRGHVLSATGQPPVFPFSMVEVVDYEQQRRLEEQEKQARERQAQQSTHFHPRPSYSQPQQQQQSYGAPAPQLYGSQNIPQGYGGQQPPQNSNWNQPPQQQFAPPVPSQNQWQPPPPIQAMSPSPMNQWQQPQQTAPPAWNQPPPSNIGPPPVTSQWGPPSSSGSTGHALPMPPIHFQPPVHSGTSQEQIYQRPGSFSQPSPTPEPPKQTLPDRSQITNSADRACYESLVRLWAKLKASKLVDKRSIEDGEHKMEILYSQMNSQQVSAPVILELKTLDRSDYQLAQKLQTDLMTKRFDVTGQWIVGVKRLVDSLERAARPAPPPISHAPIQPSMSPSMGSQSSNPGYPPPPNSRASFSSQPNYPVHQNQPQSSPAPPPLNRAPSTNLPPPPTTSWGSVPQLNASINNSPSFNQARPGPPSMNSNGPPQMNNGPPQMNNGPPMNSGYPQLNSGPPHPASVPPYSTSGPPINNGPSHMVNGPSMNNGPHHMNNGPQHMSSGPPIINGPPMNNGSPMNNAQQLRRSSAISATPPPSINRQNPPPIANAGYPGNQQQRPAHNPGPVPSRPAFNQQQYRPSFQ